MTKIYEIAGFNECKTQTVFCGVKVNLNFINGNMVQNKSARLITDNVFAQDAIEHDIRFEQGVIKLVRTIGESKKDAGKGTDAKAMPRRTGHGSKEDENSKGGENSQEAIVVEGVKTINDADAWFAEKGITLTSSKKAYIEELCAKEGVVFPNLKLK